MKNKLCILYGGNTIESNYSIEAYNYLKEKLKNNFLIKGININNLIELINLPKDYIILSIVYGNPGQDGMIASLCELLDLKYIGSNLDSCSIVKNKFVSKLLAKNIGIKVPNGTLIKMNDDISLDLDYPVIVKTNQCGGLSLGINYCTNNNELQKAIKDANNYDENILIDEFIKGTEITTCVIKKKDTLEVLPIIENKKSGIICDYNEKKNGCRKLMISPKIDSNLLKEINKTTLNLFKMFSMNDFGYFDFIIKNENIYFIEAGAVPGFTKNSNIPKIYNYYNWDLCTLFQNLL